MKTRTLREIDRDLKMLRNLLLDSIHGSKEHLDAITEINKLLDERLSITGGEKIPVDVSLWYIPIGGTYDSHHVRCH